MPNRAKTNKVYLVGELTEVSTDVREMSDGRKYISGKIVVKSTIKGEEKLTDVKLIAFEKTKSGEINRMFTSYSKLEGMLNKRVVVSGELRDGSMVQQSSGQVTHFNEIYLRFINLAKADAEDTCTFEFSGFVVKGLYERKNKEDELLGYRLDVGQANYNDTALSVLRFDVDKNDVNIAQAIESNYEVGSTVSFSGVISYTSVSETRIAEVAFGEATPKTFVRSEKVFRITGGNEPFGDEDPAKYTTEEIKALCESYKAADADRVAKTQVAEEAPNPTASAMQSKIRSQSLI